MIYTLFIASDSSINTKSVLLLKYGFCNKSFRKDETLTSWTLLRHICPHFLAWLLFYSAITPKSEDKYVVKVFNWSEVHLSEITCYKIHTLVVQGPLKDKDLLLFLLPKSGGAIEFPFLSQFRRPCRLVAKLFLQTTILYVGGA